MIGSCIEEGRAASKNLIKNLAVFFLLPSKKFLAISFKIQLLETSPPKQKEPRQKQLDVSFFWCLFPSCTFWILCSLLLLFTFCQVCLPVTETAETETGMAEKSCWDQAKNRQKLAMVWRNRKKISRIIKDYFDIPFLLSIILWVAAIFSPENLGIVFWERIKWDYLSLDSGWAALDPMALILFWKICNSTQNIQILVDWTDSQKSRIVKFCHHESRTEKKEHIFCCHWNWLLPIQIIASTLGFFSIIFYYLFYYLP